MLDRTPSTFRLLAPHQDLQFICDRPFFFMDGKRTFMVTSTGTSGKSVRPDFSDWVDANLATVWRADYFPPPTPLRRTEWPRDAILERDAASLTVLVPGPGGRRIVTSRLVPVNLQPQFSPRILLPTFWTTREYSFRELPSPVLVRFREDVSTGRG